MRDRLRRYHSYLFLIVGAAVAAAIVLRNPGAPQQFQRGIDAADHNDYAAALTTWEPLARDGHVAAQYNVGIMYERGLGVPRQPARAVRWYRLAAERGFAPAQVNLGLLSLAGEGVPKDATEAAAWFRAAADQDDPRGLYSLGRLYLDGSGLGRDPVRACRLFERAARRGHDHARVAFGDCHRDGVGGPADPVAAYAWYWSVRDAPGDPGQAARDRLAAMAHTLDAAQIERAVRLAARYTAGGEPAAPDR